MTETLPIEGGRASHLSGNMEENDGDRDQEGWRPCTPQMAERGSGEE